MELETLARQLKLMEMLVQNDTYTIKEISEMLNLSKRSVYRYLEAFKAIGFVVKKKGLIYRLDHSSPLFRKIAEGVHFTEDEAITISQILNSVYNHSPQVSRLREKLAKLYDTEVLCKHGVDNHTAQNISHLFRAIREERVVILKNYHSPSSGKVSDRMVEPYQFMNENSEVRCCEIDSGQNKTFKVSRAENVELLNLLWIHKERHQPFYNDLFHFTGETRTPVTLILGNLSTTLLLEEFPDAQRQLQTLPDGRHRLDTEVCSFLGIGRFVLGLYQDIEIVNSPNFESYIRKCVASYMTK